MSLQSIINPSDVKIVSASALEVKGKTLIFGNTLYQISNIAILELIDLTETYAVRVPELLWIVLVIIAIFTAASSFQELQRLGFLIILVIGFIFLIYPRTRVREKYGLAIYTNAGTKTAISSSDSVFIKKAIIALYEVINSEVTNRNVYINFDNRTISENKSISIGTNIGSSVVSGTVGGDVASMIN